MKLKEVLKPKTRSTIVDDFITKWIETNNDSGKYYNARDDLKNLIKFHLRERRTRVWAFSAVVWIFSITMIINGILAIEEGYFWFPIKLVEKSMFNFINIFWAISWFATAAFILILGIVIVARSYDE